jgi:hypothetical protein
MKQEMNIALAMTVTLTQILSAAHRELIIHCHPVLIGYINYKIENFQVKKDDT